MQWSCQVLLLPLDIPCRGRVLVRCRQALGDAGSSSQAASPRLTHDFAPGFGVTLAVTHFPYPLKQVLDGSGSAAAKAASARAEREMLTAIFHSIFGTKRAIR